MHGVRCPVLATHRLPLMTIGRCSRVGHDPAQGPEDDWPPPNSVRDPISGAMRIYHHGHMRPAAPGEAEGLERAAVWDLHHLIDRLMGTGPDWPM